MVPSSVAGLLLFVVLLAPGLAYVLRYERVRPARTLSPFRETLRVVFVSVTCLTVTGVLATIFRAIFPRQTPNIRGLVLDPVGYWRGHHVNLAWWALGTMLFATALGATAAHRKVVNGTESALTSKWLRWLTGSADTDIVNESAWHRIMHLFDDPNGRIRVGAAMDDGTYVDGYLFTFNVAPEENADREIALTEPRLTTKDGKVHDSAWNFTIISARHIVRLDIAHLAPEPSPATTGEQSETPPSN